MELTINPQDVTLEASLLHTMATKQNYQLYSGYVDYKRLLPNTALLLKDYKRYFNMYEDHESIHWELFYTQFSQNWHNQELDTSDIEYYRDCVFPTIKRSNKIEVETCLLGLMKKHTLEELSTGNFDVDRLRTVLDNYALKLSNITGLTDKEVSTIATVDFNVLDKTEGIPWFLPTLQEGLGSLVKGQLIVVPADIGAGKTAFVISQAAHALKHLHNANKGCILYFNSEGTDADVFGRLCSNLFRKDYKEGFEEVVENREEVREKFINRYGENSFIVAQLSSHDVSWVHAKIQKYSPALVVIDITDTLAPIEDAPSLKKVFDRLRVLSGVTCPIIVTTQAGNQKYKDSKTGEVHHFKWLKEDALYGSKTGKGGAADTLITIGKDDRLSNIRYISTPKKKRGKAVNITCQLIEEFSRYEECAW